MDPPRTYTFSASTPILSDGVTRLLFRPPEASDIASGAIPTITRRFLSDERVKREIPDIDLNSIKSRSSKSATPRERGRNSRSFVAPPSPSPEPSSVASQAHTDLSSSRASTPRPLTPDEGSDSSSHFRPTPRLTRSASRSSLRGEGVTPIRSSSSAARPLPPLNLKNVKRDEFKCMPTDEEKAQKIEPRPMYCFLLDIDEELEEPPPQLALRPDLEVDDIVCNRLHNSDPQLWAWSQVGKGRCLWKAVLRGYTRSSDGRRLNITGDPQRPAWIGDDWYRKLQRKEKAAAGKGKQRAY